jgi:serine/threonine-protein kinase
VALSAGTRLGPYEVTALIGEGGMGKVWRAHHKGLKRDDALKVLPDAFASDPDRLARFRREAQVLASLNHPNIAHVYGLEQSDGVQALVMELVEGPTLADRVARGPIPLDEALPIARQIAEALEAAHEQGIIHRDLKPANIKVRPDGTVKVLDFGLAKALEPTSMPATDATASPTLTSPAMTGVGVLLGTAAYMSPEQARGKAVDKRSDIWAFGCVLYEMLTGRRAFEGEQVSDVLASVLAREPDWTLLPRGLSPVLGTFLKRCLQKDPKQRVHAIADVRLAMQDAFETSTGQPETSRTAVPIWQRPWVAAISSVLAATLGGFIVWTTTRPAAPAPRVAQFEISLRAPETLAPASSDHDLAISPDGTYVVYRASNGDGFFLAVRAIHKLSAQLLGSTEGATFGPFVSPDGAWVGFSDEGTGTLKRVPILGGPAVPICQTGAGATGIAGASWGEDGTVVFGSGTSGGLRRVPASGGKPEELTTLAPGEVQHAWPEFLPGGRALLFTILEGGSIENAQIAVFDLESRQRKILVSGGSYPRYSGTGHIVYGIGGTLRAVPFDVGELDVTGPPVPVLENVMTKNSGAANFALARNGSLVYLSGSANTSPRTLAWVDRTGREEPLQVPPRTYLYPRVSPDGTRIALDIADLNRDIWTWEIERKTLTRLTLDPAADTHPTWTPDGRRIVFSSSRSGSANLYWQPADGTGDAEQLTESPNGKNPNAVTPDGSRLVFREATPVTTDDLLLIPLAPPRQPRLLVQTRFSERNAAISPDGRWIAFDSTESPRAEIYVRPFPDVSTGRWQVSTAGGRTPLWSRDGRELFFVSPDDVVMRLPIEAAASWRSGVPSPLFQNQNRYFHQPPGGSLARTFDVGPDGRLLMIKNVDTAGQPPNQMVLVQNWTEELKRLVPTN